MKALVLFLMVAHPPDLARLYGEDPLAVRPLLQQRVLDGESNEGLLRQLVDAVDDHSFDGLRLGGPELRRALVLQRRARAQWDSGRLDQAVTLFCRAAAVSARAGSLSEARFSLYSAAAVRAEQERYFESVQLTEEAFRHPIHSSAPMLNALLAESRGYALWYLDRLPEALEAFDRASSDWTRVGYRTALVAGHNNLATLYEAVRLPQAAQRSYLLAASLVSDDVLPEIQLQLWRNWSLFAQRQGDLVQARRLLDKALRSGFSDRVDQLWRAQVEGSEQLLWEARPRSLSERIEQQQIAGRLHKKKGRAEEAERHFRVALDLARQHELRLLERQAVEELASVLEAQQRFEEAIHLYRRSFLRHRLLDHLDTSVPYLRVISPFFSGWIRCLVRTGHITEARNEIHRFVKKRQSKAVRLTGHSSPTWRTTRISEHDRPPRQYAVVEMWPDEAVIFVWIDTPDTEHFLEIPWSLGVRRLADALIEHFAGTENILLPPPSRQALSSLYQALVAPWRSLLDSRRLLLVPHGRLQAMPFEILLDSDSRYFGDEVLISYLPSPRQRPSSQDTGELEVIFTSSSLGVRRQAQRERRHLLKLFPSARLTNRLGVERVRWLHVSSHLETGSDSWWHATIATDEGDMPLSQFLKQAPRAKLLTLGVCDSAAARWGVGPYWLGLSEVLLAAGVESLLVTRWKMDEATSELFPLFYRRVRDGQPLDEALQGARLALRGRSVGRGGERVSLQHPFFWAGVAYVGAPGVSLYPRVSRLSAPAPLLVAILASTLFLVTILRPLKQKQVAVARLKRPGESHRGWNEVD